MRALVIDDSRAMRTILTRTMEHLGFELPEGAWANAFFETRHKPDANAPARPPAHPWCSAPPGPGSRR